MWKWLYITAYVGGLLILWLGFLGGFGIYVLVYPVASIVFLLASFYAFWRYISWIKKLIENKLTNSYSGLVMTEFFIIFFFSFVLHNAKIP
jgi:hypothetical protein